MRMLKVFSLFIVCYTVSCVNDYNPFENMDNIDVKTRTSSSSIGLHDTFQIFSTESLIVYPTVFEKIDSFVVKSSGNRLWSGDSRTIVNPKAGDYRFYFSWNDTGPASIILTVYRSDGEEFSRNYNCRIVSPLHQDSVVCEVGSACTLYTQALHDQSLVYHWYFGDFYGRAIEQTHFRSGPLAVEPGIGQYQGTGLLWVDDTNGNKSTPVPFDFNFTDNHGPTIAAVSGRLSVSGDTIVTGDSLFVCRFLIMDKGGIRNVTINGGECDDREITANGEMFTKILPDMYSVSLAEPREATVVATDNAGTSTARTFYIWYSPDGPRSDAIVLRIVNPMSASWQTVDSTISIVYNLTNYSPDTVFVRAIRGDSLSGKPDTVLPRSDKKMISWDCPLTPGSNMVSVIAYRYDTLATDAVVIERSSGTIDSIPPKIPYVLINGIEGDRHVILEGEAVCTFLAIGSSGTVTTVTVNGRNATQVAGHLYRYSDTLPVSHSGTSVTVAVIDNNGLRTDTTLHSRRNSLPELQGALSRHYVIGRKQLDTLIVTDYDGDSVSFSMSADPGIRSELSFRKIDRSQVVVEWYGTGSIQEGVYAIAVSLWDGFQTVNFQKQCYVTIPEKTDIQAYTLIRTSLSQVDTLCDGTLDMSSGSSPVRIDFDIQNKLKELSDNDSVVVEHADAVYFSSGQGKFSIVLSDGRGSFLDTVNVLVKSKDGSVDTAGRIPVLYPPRTPDYINGLEYWQGLNYVNGTDITRRDPNTMEWWINRVSMAKQFFSYSDGDEPIIDGQLTPGGQPSLLFGNRSVVLIDYKNEELGLGGSWPDFPFTLFVVARTSVQLLATGGVLWSSSDYDSVYFGVGVSGNGKLALLNRQSADQAPVVTEGKLQLDTAWHLLVFRSKGRSAETNEIMVQMGTAALPKDNVTATASGVSSNLMIGCANKHVGRLAWPGYIAEVLFFKRELANGDCREVGAYLRQQHGIAFE